MNTFMDRLRARRTAARRTRAIERALQNAPRAVRAELLDRSSLLG